MPGQTGFLEALLKIGGVTALSIGVLYMLYRQIIARDIFSRLGQFPTFLIILVISIGIWSIAMVALFRSDAGLTALVFGTGNIVTQGGGAGGQK